MHIMVLFTTLIRPPARFGGETFQKPACCFVLMDSAAPSSVVQARTRVAGTRTRIAHAPQNLFLKWPRPTLKPGVHSAPDPDKAAPQHLSASANIGITAPATALAGANGSCAPPARS